MNGNKTTYDLICSLGGNCSVAHNLRYRNMRPFSLPFDWVYMEDEKTLGYLIEGFADNFKNFCLKENMERLPDTKEHKFIYRDNYSGYCFPNHFSRGIDETGEYQDVYAKMQRRIERLMDLIKRSDTILFILSVNFPLDTSLLEKLHTRLTTLFPGKKIDLNFLQFNAQKDSTFECNGGGHTRISTYIRPYNTYDFSKTNFEWEFLDNISWSKKFGNTRFPKKLFSFKLLSYKIKLIIDRNIK